MEAEANSTTSNAVHEKLQNSGVPDERSPLHYVGLGASAGGLEAIEAFFNHMPPATGLAFILIQHLSPDYKSLMVELLSKRTEMQVRRAENGMRVESDTVYLIPPKKILSIFHGKLILGDPERSRAGIFLPIDIFFRSLAEDQGDKAIGIILSGTGSDGTRGVRAIKESGGMVMVQDETTAKFDGMPRSAVSTGLVDFILPPDQMPQQLLSFVAHPEQTRTARSDTLLTDEDGLTRIFSLLRDRHKIDFTYYKPSTVVRRIERRMTVNHINTLRDYTRFMEGYPQEVTTLYRELLIGVTNFFRDPEAFNLLSEKYLPALLDQLAGPTARFWVAGCSTGEEAYTLAILCRECLDRSGSPLDIKIFATDVDGDAVIHAGNGVYSESIAADLSPDHLSQYFVRRGDEFQISRSIREMVVFAQHNLVKDPPFTNIDLVTCRNLLIYLQPVLQRKVLAHFNFSLNPNGLLFLGHSESIGEMGEWFESLDHKWKIYRSKGRSSERVFGGTLGGVRMDRNRVQRTWTSAAPVAIRRREEERLLDRLLDAMAGDYVPLTLVVNDQMALKHLVGDATGILGYPSGRVTSDVSRLAVKELSIPLSTGLQKVFKQKEEVRYSNIRLNNGNDSRKVNMRIKPLRQKKGQEPLAAIFFDSADNQNCDEFDADVAIYDLDKGAAQRIQDLEQELQFTRENLQATIEELETSNEELQATNEELLASNEELQSTNEELQSVNEELHTVNTEHQHKIMELTELNNDINNLMESSGMATLFLDENLEIRRYTPQITGIYHIEETNVGRSLHNVSHNLEDADPLTVVRQVHETNQAVERQVTTQSGDHFLMRVMPYAIGEQSYAGSIMTFIDINRQVQSQAALTESKSKFRLLAENIDDVFWLRSSDLKRFLYVSPAFEKIWGGNCDAPYKDPSLFFEKLFSDDRKKIEELLVNHSRSKWDVEYRIHATDGTLRWIHDRGFPIYDNDMQITMMCGFASDITEHKSREEMCQLSVSRFRSTFENAALGIALVDAQGNIVDSNPALHEMMAAKQETLNSKQMDDVLTTDEPITGLAAYREMMAGKRDFFQFQKRLKSSNGSRLKCNLTITLIRDASGNPNYTLVQVQTIDGQ